MSDGRFDDQRADREEIAGGRAKIYELLVGIFSTLPDQDFLERIRGKELKTLLDTLTHMDSPKYRSGLNHIRSYLSLINTKPVGKVLTDLSVDRTRILRGTGHPDMKPPYEGLYKKKEDVGETLLEVKRFYRRAGIFPDEKVPESPDFICVELDFMKHLCLRERDQWSSNADARETVVHEESFLSEHLGSWVSEFSHDVEKHGLTDFYRGFALILDAVITLDMEYLNNLSGALKRKSH